MTDSTGINGQTEMMVESRTSRNQLTDNMVGNPSVQLVRLLIAGLDHGTGTILYQEDSIGNLKNFHNQMSN